MGQRLGRILKLLKGSTQLVHHGQTLTSNEHCAQNGRQDHNSEGWPKPDQATNLYEKRYLNQRNEQKQQKQSHLTPLVAGAPVDSALVPPYICALIHRNPSIRSGKEMSSSLIQLLVLAGIAIFLILRLRSVLGTRDGFEKPPIEGQSPTRRASPRPEFDVIEGGPDRDITDHVEDGSSSAKALASMKMAENGFNVSEFLEGARGAYEMILMAFENGDLSTVEDFLGDDVKEAFQGVIDHRNEEGLKIEANFVGVREIALKEAAFDRETNEGEMTIKFVGELTSVVRDAEGEIVEGNPNEIKKQRDVWTFARTMGADNPNWQLVATGE